MMTEKQENALILIGGAVLSVPAYYGLVPFFLTIYSFLGSYFVAS